MAHLLDAHARARIASDLAHRERQARWEAEVAQLPEVQEWRRRAAAEREEREQRERVRLREECERYLRRHEIQMQEAAAHYEYWRERAREEREAFRARMPQGPRRRR